MAQVEIVNGIRLNSSLIDYNGDAGTSGQILSSTGDGVDWIDAPGISGSGSSGQVAFWNGTSSITGENDLWYDSTNDRLGIDNNSPSEKIEIGNNSTSDGQNKLRINYYDGVENISQIWLNGGGAIDVSMNTVNNGTFAIRGYDNSSYTFYAFWNSSGRMQLNQYGSGTFTGTAQKMLAVDSSGIVIEETLPTSSDTTYDLTVPTSTTAIRLAGSDATNDDVTISGTTNETEVTRISATELRVGLPTDVTIAGTTTTNNINIADTLSYDYPAVVDSSAYNGEIVTFGTFPTGAGSNGTIAAGDIIVYTTAGLSAGWMRAQGSVSYGKGMLGIAMGTTPSAGILIKGFAKNTAFTSGGLGAVLYLDPSNAGDTTSTIPSATNDIVRIVGYMVDASADVIFFDPDKSWVQVS